MEIYRNTLSVLADEYLHQRPGPWIVAWSGGKDSSLLLHATCEVVNSIPLAKRSRRICILVNDTQVESPFVANYLEAKAKQISEFLENSKLPIRRWRDQKFPLSGLNLAVPCR